MIPQRKNSIPPRKIKADELQINRLFDSVEEMRDYLNNNFKGGYTVVKQWNVTQIGCVIEVKK